MVAYGMHTQTAKRFAQHILMVAYGMHTHTAKRFAQHILMVAYGMHTHRETVCTTYSNEGM